MIIVDDRSNTSISNDESAARSATMDSTDGSINRKRSSAGADALLDDGDDKDDKVKNKYVYVFSFICFCIVFWTLQSCIFLKFVYREIEVTTAAVAATCRRKVMCAPTNLC